MNQYVIIFVFTIVMVSTQVYGQNELYGKQEFKCIQKGGLCIQKSECPEFVGAEGELCSEQYSQGFQCCAKLPVSEKRCHMRGGECFQKNYCNKNLLFNDATGCGADQECCLLI